MTSAATHGAGRFVDVLGDGELAPGSQKVVRIGANEILLVRAEELLFAVENICPHALLPLAGGRMDGSCVTCPRHGARFDLRTGKPVNSITNESLKVYSVRTTNGRIQVEIH